MLNTSIQQIRFAQIRRSDIIERTSIRDEVIFMGLRSNDRVHLTGAL